MEDLIVKERETRDNIAQVINNSNLPAFILKPMIKELYEQLVILEQRQLEEAKKVKEQKEKEQEENKKIEKEA